METGKATAVGRRLVSAQKCAVTLRAISFAPGDVELHQAGERRPHHRGLRRAMRCQLVARVEQHSLRLVVSSERHERGTKQALGCAETPVIFEERAPTDGND